MKYKQNKKHCRKVGYKTMGEAQTALDDYGRARGSVRAYRCPLHDEEMYHLTSQERKYDKA